MQIFFPEKEKPRVWISDPQSKPMSERTSSSIVSPTVGQNPDVSPTNRLIRKRPADTSPETLLRAGVNSPLEDLLPAKCTPNPNSEPTLVTPAENPTPLVLTDKNPEPKQTLNKKLFAGLASIMRQSSFKNNQPLLVSTPDNAETTTSSGSLECWEDLKSLKMKSEVSTDTAALDPKGWLIKYPAHSNSVPETKTGAFVDLNIKSDVAPTAYLNDPQSLQRIGTQDDFRNGNRVTSTGAVTSYNSGQISQSNPETGSSNLPINTIITTRPNPNMNTFQGSTSSQLHTQVSLPSDPPANLTNTTAAYGGFYAPYSQAPYPTGGDSSYFISQTFAGYATQNAASFSQNYMYPQQTGNVSSLHPVTPGLAAQPPPGWDGVGLQHFQYYYLWERR